MEMACAQIARWVSERTPNYVCVSSVHGIIECQNSEELTAIHNAAGMVTPDGMPLVWLSWLSGQRQVDRVYGPDLMLAVCADSATTGYRHYLYGSSPDVLHRLEANLIRRFPQIQIVGSYSPPYRALSREEDEAEVAAINAARPDIVWVGLGTSKQERWMGAYRPRLTAPVLIGVGAAFDFHAGLKPQAPHWMQHSGLEWIFRLANEPRRLWKRYLFSNPRFVYLVALQWLGLRRFSLDRRR